MRMLIGLVEKKKKLFRLTSLNLEKINKKCRFCQESLLATVPNIEHYRNCMRNVS